MVPCLPEEKESMEMTDCDDQFRTKQFIFILQFSLKLNIIWDLE